jgi:hypothetical protein
MKSWFVLPGCQVLHCSIVSTSSSALLKETLEQFPTLVRGDTRGDCDAMIQPFISGKVI